MFLRKLSLLLLFSAGLLFPQQQPKLVVGIVIDQMRFDYLYRFKENYGEDGFVRLMKEGSNLLMHIITMFPLIPVPAIQLFIQVLLRFFMELQATIFMTGIQADYYIALMITNIPALEATIICRH